MPEKFEIRKHKLEIIYFALENHSINNNIKKYGRSATDSVGCHSVSGRPRSMCIKFIHSSYITFELPELPKI